MWKNGKKAKFMKEIRKNGNEMTYKYICFKKDTSKNDMDMVMLMEKCIFELFQVLATVRTIAEHNERISNYVNDKSFK